MASITIFRNQFSDEHESISVAHGIRVCDAISFDHENSIVFINAIQKKYDSILDENDICLIREFVADPVTIVNILIITALVLPAYQLANNITKALTGKSIFEHAMIGLRKMMLGDQDSGDMNDIEKIPFIRGAKNQSALDKKVPVIFGTHLITPYRVGFGYSEVFGEDGENQYFHLLYNVGYNGLLLKEIRFDNLLVASNSEKAVDGYLTIDDDFIDDEAIVEIRQSDELAYYPQKVVEEQLQIELSCVKPSTYHIRNEPIRVTAKYAQSIEVEIHFPALLSHDKKGNAISASAYIQAQYRALNSVGEWTNFPLFTGAEAATYTDLKKDGSSSIESCSKFTRNKAKGLRFVSRIDLTYSSSAPQYYEIRLRRLSPNATDTTTTDAVYLTAVRTWVYDYKASKNAGEFVIQRPIPAKLRVNTCRVAIRVKASDDLSGALDAINMIASTFARTWNGTSWVSKIANQTMLETSNNPASMLLLAIQGAHVGKRAYSDSELDMDSIAHLYDVCKLKGYTCNGVLTTARKLEDIVDFILDTCRSVLIIKDGKRSVLIDEPRTIPVTVLNQQNTMSASNTKSFDEIPDGLKVTFIDEDDGYQKNERYVMLDGKDPTEPNLNLQDVEFTWITNRDHVYRIGRYNLACMILRPERYMRKVGPEGYTYPIGGLYEIQDDTILVGQNSGGLVRSVIRDGANITGIICDSYFDMEADIDYGIKVVHSDGISNPVVKVLRVVTIPGYSNQFTLTSAITDWEPLEDDIVAFGEYEYITLPAILVNKIGDEKGCYELTLVPYDPAIYNADTEDIPEFDSKITRPISSTTEPIPPNYATKEDIADAVATIVETGDPTWTPDKVIEVSAIASKDGISISWPWAGLSGINLIQKFVIELNRGTETWVILPDAKSNNYFYTFDRDIDGYPSSENLGTWRVRVKAVNVYGKVSESYGPSEIGQLVSVASYIGWTPVDPSIDLRVSGRGVSIGYGTASDWYGKGKTDIQIAKGYSVDSETGEISVITDLESLIAYSPAIGLDPTLSYENYKEGSEDGFLSRGGTAFFVSLPLYGQNEDPATSRDTPYFLRLRSSSDIPTTASPNARLVGDWTTWNLVYAHASGAQDIVRAWKLNDLGERVKIAGALGAHQLYAEFLSSITANLGVITDGAMVGNENNMWALSRIMEDDSTTVRYYEGTVRMGGNDQYLRITPRVVSEVVVGYDIDFKVGNFTVTATGSVVNGKFEVRNASDNVTYFTVDPNDNGRVDIKSMLVIGNYTAPQDRLNVQENMGVGDVVFTGTGNNDLQFVTEGAVTGSFDVEVVLDGHVYRDGWVPINSTKYAAVHTSVYNDTVLISHDDNKLYRISTLGGEPELVYTFNSNDTITKIVNLGSTVYVGTNTDLGGIQTGVVYISTDSGASFSASLYEASPIWLLIVYLESATIISKSGKVKTYNGTTWDLVNDIGEEPRAADITMRPPSDLHVVIATGTNKIWTGTAGWGSASYSFTHTSECTFLKFISADFFYGDVTGVLRRRSGSTSTTVLTVGVADRFLSHVYFGYVGADNVNMIFTTGKRVYRSTNGDSGPWNLYETLGTIPRGAQMGTIANSVPALVTVDIDGAAKILSTRAYQTAQWRADSGSWTPINIDPGVPSELTGYGIELDFAHWSGHVSGDTWSFVQRAIGGISVKDKNGVEYFAVRNGVVTAASIVTAGVAIRARVTFNGTVGAHVAGTYVIAGGVCTVTMPDHGHIVGHFVYINFTSGSAADQKLYISGVPDKDHYTIVYTGITTSGNLYENRVQILGSYNIHSVSVETTGIYYVNFLTAMPDANYTPLVTSNDQVSATNFPKIQSGGPTGTPYVMSATCLQVAAASSSHSSRFCVVIIE